MKTNELLIITLAIVILTATYITINPSITGFAIIQPDFPSNENIIINQTIQLKQHQIIENQTLQVYYPITSAEKIEQAENQTIQTDELANLIQLDNETTNLGKEDLLNIQFSNNFKTVNLHLESNKQPVLNINNNSLTYTEQGFYQLDLPPASELTITVSENTKINCINASNLETVQNTTYYYIPSEIESEIIEINSKWDLFTANYQLNNQTLKFFYRTNQTYTEFTPPHNFSEINSDLQFKIFLSSNNISTPVIYNLSINQIFQESTENNTEEPQSENNPPAQAPSLTRYTPKTTVPKSAPKAEAPKITAKAVSQPIQLKTEPETPIQLEENIQVINKPKIIGNTIAVSYLAFLCLLLYRKRHKL